MEFMVRAEARIICCLMLALSLTVVSCGGGDGVKRYRVKGTVKYQGKPVEFGAIFFEPTASVGEIAPTSYLPIRNGTYDAKDEGPTTGKYNVLITGTDQSNKKVDSDGITHTGELFKQYTFQVDIPPPDNTLNVDVPDTQALK